MKIQNLVTLNVCLPSWTDALLTSRWSFMFWSNYLIRNWFVARSCACFISEGRGSFIYHVIIWKHVSMLCWILRESQVLNWASTWTHTTYMNVSLTYLKREHWDWKISVFSYELNEEKNFIFTNTLLQIHLGEIDRPVMFASVSRRFPQKHLACTSTVESAPQQIFKHENKIKIYLVCLRDLLLLKLLARSCLVNSEKSLSLDRTKHFAWAAKK